MYGTKAAAAAAVPPSYQIDGVDLPSTVPSADSSSTRRVLSAVALSAVALAGAALASGSAPAIGVASLFDTVSPPTTPDRASNRPTAAPTSSSYSRSCGKGCAKSSTSATGSGTGVGSTYGHGTDGKSAAPPPSGSTNSHTIHVSNELERAHGFKIGQGYLPWERLAEVYMPTLLEVVEPKEDLTYTWKMTTKGEYNEMQSDASGVEMTFKEPGWHTVQLEASDGSTSTFEVMAKYVRREIRNLTDDAREMFFDTLQAVYTTSQTDGEKKYGPKFRSIERMVAEHLRGAADKECDHWHDDAGVLTHHVAYTLEMEQSLQSIEPSVTIPYWDYTIDAFDYGAGDWPRSLIFSDDWFGKASPNNTDHILDTGRWAYTKVTKGALETSPRNPYGLLRSPWNTNPHPYLMRYRYVGSEKDGGWTMPGCSDFETAWEADHISKYFSNLNGFLHGPVHIMIGGQWWDNPDYAMDMTYGGELLLASKWLWRQGYIRCPEACSADMPSQDCACSCPSELMTEWKDESWPNGVDARRFLKDVGLFNMSHELFQDYDDDQSLVRNDFSCDSSVNKTTCYERMLKSLCHVGHAGEMFTSAAPWDPIFWPIHGFADRYLALKRLKAEKGTTTLVEKWAYSHLTDDGTGESPSDTRHVCDWSGVESGSMQMPHCYIGACSGHRKNDMLPMSNFLGMGETYTNIEFLNFTDPSNDFLPYTYDTFDYYPACETLGIRFWKNEWRR